MINKVLDGLFIINSGIMVIVIIALLGQFFGFVTFDVKITLMMCMINPLYLIEGILVNRRYAES